MSDKSDKDQQKGQAEAVDAFAAVAAVGFAVASRTMEMWFGAMSGFARASREMLAPHIKVQSQDSESEAPAASAPSEGEIVAKAGPGPVTDLPARKRSKQYIPAPKAEVSKFQKRAPKAIERPSASDDLKQIAGIGPKLEQVLNDAGLWTYRQVADLQAEEVAWLDDLLGLNGRVAADKWLEQAEALEHAKIDKRDVAAG